MEQYNKIIEEEFLKKQGKQKENELTYQNPVVVNAEKNLNWLKTVDGPEGDTYKINVETQQEYGTWLLDATNNIIL